jgi:chemotaxis protein methyltransferase CheR
MYTKDLFISVEEFQLLRDLVSREFGLLVRGDKRLTFHTKISHRLHILGLASYRAYYDYIVSDPSRAELFILASHITNNETYFFREKSQLKAFSEILKDIKKERMKKNQNMLRILSIPCSSGEEAFSLNILIQESGLLFWNWDIKITGIDIDKSALEKAQQAWYTSNSLRSMNGRSLENTRKYFRIDEDKYHLRSPFLKNVEFRHGNIIDPDSFSVLDTCDIIFCRNLLIYMSDEAIDKIIMNLYNTISDTGYLFLGTSESLIQKTDLFTPEYINGTVVYRKNVKN